MRLFDNSPYDGYERIRRAAPRFLDEVLDVQGLYETAGIEHDNIREGITGITNSVIVPWCNEDDCERYEKYFRIEYSPGVEPSLDFRRAMIAAKFVALHHIGRPEILSMVWQFAPGKNSWCDFNDGYIDVLVDGYLSDEDAFLNMMLEKIPAHLGLHVTVRITRTFRWEPGFAVAGGVEGYLHAEPLDVHHEVRQEYAVLMSAITRGDFTGEPVDANRQERHELTVLDAGYTQSHSSFEPPDVNRRERQNLEPIQTSTARFRFTAEPVDAERSERQDFNVLHAGYTQHQFTGEPVDAYACEEYQLGVGQGASVVQSVSSDIPGPHPRAETREISLGEAAFARTEQTREPVGPPRVSGAIDPEITQHVNRRADVRGAPIDAGPNTNRHQAPSPGGAFIVSHISTKRIPE